MRRGAGRRRVLGGALAALVGAVLAGTGVAAPAHAARPAASSSGATSAQPQADVAWYWIQNVNSSLFLAISNSSDANGAAAIQWDKRTQPNGLPSFEQAWTDEYYGGDNYYYRNAGTNPWQTLAIGGGVPANKVKGAKAIQWPLEIGNLEQQWRPYYWPDNTYELVNANSGMCLAIGGGYPANKARGLQAIQWMCNGGLEQRWRTLPA